ncbi:MAG: GNAT family N-acetyltransferase [Bacteroidota bacterium]
MNNELLEPIPRYETERLVMRKLTMEDAEDVFEYASNPEVSKYVTWETHRTINDSISFIKMTIEKYEHEAIGDWGLEYKANGKLIGTCGFVNWNKQHHWAGIGYVLSRDYWNRGIMTEAASVIIRHGFEKMDLNRIEAHHMIENIASGRVMQKVGMTFEGVVRGLFFARGTHHDVKLYSILKSEFLRG